MVKPMAKRPLTLHAVGFTLSLPALDLFILILHK